MRIKTRGINVFLINSLLLLLGSSRLEAQEIVSNQMIWKGNDYAAFTSLVHFNGYYYCAFREAKKHYDTFGKDCGVIKIIKSKDTRKWTEFLTFAEDGFDFRDPQLSITPNKQIMLLTERVRYKDGKAVQRNSCTSFINKKGDHSPLNPIVYEDAPYWNWLWSVTWIDGIAYGFIYSPSFSFVKSNDGIHFQTVNKFDLDGTPTEASVIKKKRNVILACVRRDKANAIVGEYDVKLNEWKWTECKVKIGCPFLIEAFGNFYIVGRSYQGETKTSLYVLHNESMLLERIIDIGGGMDCAYPGAVYIKGKLFVSYYQGDGNSADIYLSIINLKNK